MTMENEAWTNISFHWDALAEVVNGIGVWELDCWITCHNPAMPLYPRLVCACHGLPDVRFLKMSLRKLSGMIPMLCGESQNCQERSNWRIQSAMCWLDFRDKPHLMALLSPKLGCDAVKKAEVENAF